MLLARAPRAPATPPLRTRPFSLSRLSHLPKRAKPSRPEPHGVIKAYFPRTNETLHIHETKGQYAQRWEQYVKDLGAITAPEKVDGRAGFGTRVRVPGFWRRGERSKGHLRPPRPQWREHAGDK